MNRAQSLIITDANLLAKGNSLELHKLSTPLFNFKMYPANILNFEKNMNKKVGDGFTSFSVIVNSTFPKFMQTRKDAATAEVKLPETLPSHISDVFAKVDYLGGQAEIIQNEKVQTDNLYNGTSWLAGLKRFIGTGSISFQAKDWNDNITRVADEKVQQIKKNGTMIKLIEIIPQYKIALIVK